MERDLSSVDSLLHEAGLLTDARRASAVGPEMPRPLGLTSRTASITDLNADLLGVKLDDCSRYFKREIMVAQPFLFTEDKLPWCSSQQELISCSFTGVLHRDKGKAHCRRQSFGRR